MRILFTGFDPFGGEKVNPAFEAVKRLPDRLCGAEIVKAEVPTVYGKDGEVLEAALEKYQPDVTICVGQAGGRSGMTVEQVAINLMEARIPDNAGSQPSGLPVVEGGPAAYFSTLPVKAIVEKMKGAGIPARISYTAGTFVCNDIMYRLLHLAATECTSMKGGFIHVPYLPEQVLNMPDGVPSMSVEMIEKALEAAVEAVAG